VEIFGELEASATSTDANSRGKKSHVISRFIKKPKY
jgi:hypothetical protein